MGSVSRHGALRVKRVFDVVFCASALVALLPLIALIALLVRVSLGSPVLFRQPRTGYQGKEFVLLKFRTMTMERDAQGQLLPDEQRMTRLGSLLRATSLDEIPEAINVLRGEMSVIGPRPLLVGYRDFYSPEQWRRHCMPPGMAGPVIIGGRNGLSWADKLALDVWYVDHWSLWLDMKVLLLSALSVIRRQGVSKAGYATTEPFRGSNDTAANA